MGGVAVFRGAQELSIFAHRQVFLPSALVHGRIMHMVYPRIQIGDICKDGKGLLDAIARWISQIGGKIGLWG